MLLEAGVEQRAIDEHLMIQAGDVQNQDAVKAAVQVNGAVADIIIFGIGMIPKYSGNPLQPIGGEQTDICQVASRAVIDSVRILAPAKKPTLIAISTTGISKVERDVPLAFYPLYKLLLGLPHKDKEIMEKAINDAVSEGILGGKVIVRPSLFKDDTPATVQTPPAVKVGIEGKQKAIGYFISRKAVGRWLFQEILEKNVGEWKDQTVSITW